MIEFPQKFSAAIFFGGAGCAGRHCQQLFHRHRNELGIGPAVRQRRAHGDGTGSEIQSAVCARCGHV